MPDAEAEDEVGVDVSRLLQAAAATMERVLDGDAAQLTHHWDAEALGQGSSRYAEDRYPDFVQIAKGYGCGAATISKKADLVPALEEMIEYDGPYVLDVEVPYQEHVMPMIPAGGTVKDLINE